MNVCSTIDPQPWWTPRRCGLSPLPFCMSSKVPLTLLDERTTSTKQRQVYAFCHTKLLEETNTGNVRLHGTKASAPWMAFKKPWDSGKNMFSQHILAHWKDLWLSGLMPCSQFCRSIRRPLGPSQSASPGHMPPLNHQILLQDSPLNTKKVCLGTYSSSWPPCSIGKSANWPKQEWNIY